MNCPSHQQFEDYLNGGEADLNEDFLDSHLAECATCRETLSRKLQSAERLERLFATSLANSADVADLPDGWQQRLRARASWVAEHGFPPESLPVDEFVFPEAPTAQGPLGRVEHYHIVRLLGRGGFGEVYQAWDQRVNRSVAVKLLLPPRHLPSPAGGISYEDECRQRFQREAMLASQVKNDHVVNIYHLGEFTLRNSPAPVAYVEMEFMAGGTLRQLLRSGEVLGYRKIAEIARQIATGIGAAHARGVVHRDLKPENILFDVWPGASPASRSSEPGEPGQSTWRAKIADFGVATLAHPSPFADHLTHEGDVPGTAGYMSPEQAKGERDVDSSSDVYSLGIMLYEMLCGELPFRGGLPEVIQQKLTREPPSLRDQHRQIPQDLETITRKCCRLEPDRRYSHGGEVAEDLRRFLESRPIHARPVSPVERVWLSARRNPRLATTMVLLVLAILGGLAGITAQWLRAEQQWKRAEMQREIAQAHLEQVHDNWRKLKASFDKIAVLASDASTRRDAVDANRQAVDLAERLARAFPDRVDFREQLARSYNDLGEGLDRLGERAEAREWHQRANGVWEGLSARDAGNASFLFGLAASCNNLAVLETGGGEALELLKKSEALLGRLESTGQLDRRGKVLLAGVRRNRGNRLLEQGLREESLDCYRRAAGMLEGVVSTGPFVAQDMLALVESYNSMGVCLSRSTGHELVYALEFYDRAVEVIEPQIVAPPASRAALDAFARISTNRGRLHWRLGKIEQAQHDLTRSVDVRARLVALDPTDVRTVSALGNATIQLAGFLSEQGATGEARSRFEESIAILTPLTTDFPHQVVHRDRLAQAYSAWAIAELRAGRNSDALERLAASIPIWRELSNGDIQDRSFLLMYSKDLGNQAVALQGLGRTAEAIDSLDQCQQIQKRLASRFPGDALVQRDYAMTFELQGQLFLDSRQPREALASFEESLAIRRRLARSSPELSIHQAMATSLMKVGEALLTSNGDPDEARRAYAEAHEVFEKLVWEAPSTSEFRADRATCRKGVARVFEAMNDWQQAYCWEELSGCDLDDALALVPGNSELLRRFDEHVADAARILRRLGRHADALESILRRRKRHSDNPHALAELAWQAAACANGVDPQGTQPPADQRVEPATIRAAVLELMDQAVSHGFSDADFLTSIAHSVMLADDPTYRVIWKRARAPRLAPAN